MSGTIRPEHSVLDSDDGEADFLPGYYEAWSIDAFQGDQIHFFLASSSFDTKLIVGRDPNNFVVLAENDDYNGTLNSKLSFNFEENGTYLVLVTNLNKEAVGPYQIFVTRQESGSSGLPRQFQAMEESAASGDVNYDQSGQFRYYEDNPNPWPLLSLLALVVGVIWLVKLNHRPIVVRSMGRPVSDPTVLRHLDSWQTVLFNLGARQDEVRTNLFETLQEQVNEGGACSKKPISYWSSDGEMEKEQIVFTCRKGIIYCHINQVGDDLYVAWDAHINYGAWAEYGVAAGIDSDSGERTKLMGINKTIERINEYDLADLNSAIESVHAKFARIISKILKEQKVDQEVDFSIIRGDRQDAQTHTAQAAQERKRSFASRFTRTR